MSDSIHWLHKTAGTTVSRLLMKAAEHEDFKHFDTATSISF